ncbi:MAG: hypothetical protein ACTTIC_03725 [Helicobacteraceae bacterium]
MELNNIQSRMQAISGAFKPGNLGAQKTAAKEPDAKIVGAAIKEEASSIKNINDQFGLLKKAEITLGKIQDALGAGDKQEALSLLNSTYKDVKFFYDMKLDKLNLGDLLASEIQSGDNTSFILKNAADMVANELSLVKDLMLKKSQAMGDIAQKSVGASKPDVDLPSLVKSTDVQYLKQHIQELLG